MRQSTMRTLASLLLTLCLAGCVAETGTPGPGSSATFPLPPPPTVDEPAPTVAATAVPLAPLVAPTQDFPVSRRVLELSNGDRPLRTLLLFPSADFVDGSFDVAPGRFPLVLFSHGLQGSPELYESYLTRIAAAGFVVAAPTYPHTSMGATSYDPVDVLNQPADASSVITAVLALADDEDDRLWGHLDALRIAAVGHSAGGYTTAGLLGGDRDERVRAAVVLSGAGLFGPFTGPAATVLFVHGEDDTVVPYAYGRTTYRQVPWPKAFVSVVDGGHADYLVGASPARAPVAATVLDFLRATLYGDDTALARMGSEAAVEGATRLESTLVFPTPSAPAPASAPGSASATGSASAPASQAAPGSQPAPAQRP